MKFRDLFEEEKQVHNYGCVMLYFDFPKISEIHKKIEKEDIYTELNDNTFGLEDEPHTTLLYGLHEKVSLNDIKKVLSNFKFTNCKIKNPSLFENEGKPYDVLKFDVEGKNLYEANKILKKYPYTSDFPDYHPHMTIAYINKGKGKKYVNKLKNINEFNLKPKYIVYSQIDGSKDKIKL